MRVRREEGIRLQRARALQPFVGNLLREIEKENGDADVGEMRRDLGPHGSGAKHGGRADVRSGHCVCRPFRKRSTTASASASSGYRRRLRIQLVAISSSAPKSAFE